MADTVLCNGDDLADYLSPIGLLKGFLAPPPGVGADYQIPGYIGALPAQLGRGPRNVMVGGLILGWDIHVSPLPQENVEEAREAYHVKLLDFTAAVFQSGNPFTIAWVTGPPDALITRQTTARYLGGLDDIEELTPWAARVAVEFMLLDPLWH